MESWKAKHEGEAALRWQQQGWKDKGSVTRAQELRSVSAILYELETQIPAMEVTKSGRKAGEKCPGFPFLLPCSCHQYAPHPQILTPTRSQLAKNPGKCAFFFFGGKWSRQVTSIEYQDNSMGERIVFSANGSRTTRYPQEKEWSCTPPLHHMQKLTQNGSWTYMVSLNY